MPPFAQTLHQWQGASLLLPPLPDKPIAPGPWTVTIAGEATDTLSEHPPDGRLRDSNELASRSLLQKQPYHRELRREMQQSPAGFHLCRPRFARYSFALRQS